MDPFHRDLLRAVVRAALALLVAPTERIAVARTDLLDALERLADVLADEPSADT